ncbi:hypothetical protein EDB89DRAFT_1555897 [Lactarius sanguifluus]|nr:hypothetical protein EDB89DRAFT_1555897 [Lactarius sanguifluus]
MSSCLAKARTSFRRILITDFRIPHGANTSTSRDTGRSPLSHILRIYGSQRVFGGHHGPSRHPQLNSVSITYTDCLDVLPNFPSASHARPSSHPSSGMRGYESFGDDSIHFRFFRETDPDSPTIAIQIVSNGPIPELVVDMAQLLNQTSAMLSDVVRLEVTINYSSPYRQGDLRYDIAWLELFRPFTAVKKLGICEELAEYISRALEGRNKEAVTQVLPALEKLISVEDQHAKDMKELLANFRGEGDSFLSDSDEGLYSDDSE